MKTLKWHPTKTGWTGGYYPRTVNSVAFSPDGKMFASGYEQEQTIKLWDILSDRELWTFTWRSEHSIRVYADVYSVVFSPESRFLAGGSDDGGTIKLFDVKTGHVIKALEGHSGTVRSVAFSGDRKILASGSEDTTIKFWNVSLLDPGLAKVFFANEREKEAELQTIAQLLKPKDEFETEVEYRARILKGNDEKKVIEEKYIQKYLQLKDKYEKTRQVQMETQAREMDAKIQASVTEVTLKISKIGLYDADTETFPITIQGVTKTVKIPRAEARSLKEKWQIAVVKGFKRLKKDLSTFEHIDLVIIHPETSSRFPFVEP